MWNFNSTNVVHGEESPNPQTRSRAHDIKYLPIEHTLLAAAMLIDNEANIKCSRFGGNGVIRTIYTIFKFISDI